MAGLIHLLSPRVLAVKLGFIRRLIALPQLRQTIFWQWSSIPIVRSQIPLRSHTATCNSIKPPSLRVIRTTADPNYWTTNKISTSPVPLNSPAGTPNSFNGDTFSATLTYDGTNLTLNMYDVTAGGSCPGTRCFTQTWSAIDIPSIVNGDTAYVGFTAASGGASDYNLYINSLVYTVNSAPASPSLTTYTSQPYMTGTTPTANPTYSPPARYILRNAKRNNLHFHIRWIYVLRPRGFTAVYHAPA